ncbi:basic proline-rich protein-like [Canis lupus familiaris]|uniref:basic proline-rich protein-like n=1 Tax=Canis lupus familiaris TaxID=9615 RepID=UPI0018F2AE2E|nr:basic proline-rich protein-like [Canis lupus familiaris]
MKTRPDPIEGAEEDFPGKTVLGTENEGCVSRDEVVGRPNSQRAGNGKHKGTRGPREWPPSQRPVLAHAWGWRAQGRRSDRSPDAAPAHLGMEELARCGPGPASPSAPTLPPARRQSYRGRQKGIDVRRPQGRGRQQPPGPRTVLRSGSCPLPGGLARPQPFPSLAACVICQLRAGDPRAGDLQGHMLLWTPQGRPRTRLRKLPLAALSLNFGGPGGEKASVRNPKLMALKTMQKKSELAATVPPSMATPTLTEKWGNFSPGLPDTTAAPAAGGLPPPRPEPPAPPAPARSPLGPARPSRRPPARAEAAGARGVGGAGAAARPRLGGAAEGAAPAPRAYLARLGLRPGAMVRAAGGRHCGAPGGGAAPAAEPRASAGRLRAREREAAKPRRLDFPGTGTGRRGDPARALRPRPRPRPRAPARPEAAALLPPQRPGLPASPSPRDHPRRGPGQPPRRHHAQPGTRLLGSPRIPPIPSGGSSGPPYPPPCIPSGGSWGPRGPPPSRGRGGALCPGAPQPDTGAAQATCRPAAPQPLCPPTSGPWAVRGAAGRAGDSPARRRRADCSTSRLESVPAPGRRWARRGEGGLGKPQGEGLEGGGGAGPGFGFRGVRRAPGRGSLCCLEPPSALPASAGSGPQPGLGSLGDQLS